jgi:hypothetical protein
MRRLGFLTALVFSMTAGAALGGCSSGGSAPSAAGVGDAGMATGGANGGRGGDAGSGLGNGGSNGGKSGTGGHGGAGGKGGNGAIGGAGASALTCNVASDCVVPTIGGAVGSAECVLPGGTPRDSGGCGAPGWCGQCACPPAPPIPYETNKPCTSSTDCPKTSADPSTAHAASSCGTRGYCLECEVDSDCPRAFPRCGRGVPATVPLCQECFGDVDCPLDRAHCISTGAGAPSGVRLGHCAQCSATADCKTGICSDNACVAECGSTAPCTEFAQCGAAARCVPKPCTTVSDCPAHARCTAGTCARITCSTNGDCSGGYCVQGACYSELGTCAVHYAYP